MHCEEYTKKLLALLVLFTPTTPPIRNATNGEATPANGEATPANGEATPANPIWALEEKGLLAHSSTLLLILLLHSKPGTEVNENLQYRERELIERENKIAEDDENEDNSNDENDGI